MVLNGSAFLDRRSLQRQEGRLLMSEPPEVKFPCIGCGALNPIGAETCVGCGHRFAGPDSATALPVADQPKSAPLSPSHDEPYYIADTTTSTSGTSFAQHLLRVLGGFAAIVFTVVAFIIAFFTTCFAVGSASNNIGVGVVAGTLAGGAAMAGMGMLVRYLFKTASNSGRGKPR
jgi:hypothetical protein